MSLPIREWLPGYRTEWLRGDAIAGLTLAAYVIPQSMAYASLGGFPPETGLYCYLLAGLAYAVFGSSHTLAVGTTASIALLVSSALSGMSGGDLDRYVDLAMLAALLVAAIGVLAWFFRLGQIGYFVSETILVGFKAGAAFVIASTQLPKLFGIPAAGDHFFERVRHLATHLGETNPASLATGLVALALLLFGARISRRLPIPLLVVAGSIAVSSWWDLGARGVAVVGEIPGGLPSLGLPAILPGDVLAVLPLALACFLLAYVEGVSTARALAIPRGERIDPDQELLAVGITNLAAGLGHGFPVAGGMSQSAVNTQAGARTPLSLALASGVLALVLLFLTGVFRNLPQPVLAALVLSAVVGLVDVPQARSLRRLSLTEFRVSLVAFVGVLVLGILEGVLLAAIVSLLVLIRRAAAPRVALLGAVPGSDQFADREHHPENALPAGALVLRPGGALLYFNVESVERSVRERLAETPAPLVVIDLSAVPALDLAGARMLRELRCELAERGVDLRLAEARGAVRELLCAPELETGFGPLPEGATIASVIAKGAESRR